MIKFIRVILVAALIMPLVFISCSSSGEKESKAKASFTNTRWVLRVLNDKRVYTPEGGKEAFITFGKDTAKAYGSGGCNNFFGNYVKDGSSLKIGPVARTEMFCEGRMETEDAFLKALESTVSYKISGNDLSLFSSEKLIAKFEAVYLN